MSACLIVRRLVAPAVFLVLAESAVSRTQAEEPATPTMTPTIEHHVDGARGVPMGDGVPASSSWIADLVQKVFSYVSYPINVYSSDPNVRMERLLIQTEDTGQRRVEGQKYWFTDKPSHMTYERVHGGIGP